MAEKREAADSAEPVHHNVVASKVNNDDLMAFIYYGRVNNTAATGGNHVLRIRSVEGLQDFSVSGNELIERGLSADQYADTKKITRTEMAVLLAQSFNVPFTVVFTKADGSVRKLRGRLVSTEPIMGRSYVEDLDIDQNDPKGRLRLVDHRTIEVLIVHGVKYTLK